MNSNWQYLIVDTAVESAKWNRAFPLPQAGRLGNRSHDMKCGSLSLTAGLFLATFHEISEAQCREAVLDSVIKLPAAERQGRPKKENGLKMLE